MKLKYVSLFAVFLVLISSIPIFSSGSISTTASYAYARYAADAQTQANANECTSGTNCGITSPQTQGHGTANSPINLQISNFNEDRVQEEVPTERIITVTKKVECPTGFECPSPSQSTLRVNLFGRGTANPDTFQGSATGTTVVLSLNAHPGEGFVRYVVEEVSRPDPPTGLRLFVSESSGCDSVLDPALPDESECIITNEYKVIPTTGTLQVCKDQGSSEGTYQFRVIRGNNPSPSEFSLTPGACQDVTMGRGAYEISENNGGIAFVSGDCNLNSNNPPLAAGAIGIGQTQNCTFLNTELDTATLNVVTNVICPDGFDCPTPEEVTITMIQPPPHILTTFQGSSEGTPVTIIANMPYQIGLGYRLPEGLNSFSSYSENCFRQLASGEIATCAITITFFVP